jgi:uncharacterized iron-regulated membrane protein
MFAVKARILLRQLHLWAGLCFGSLFVLAGLTGSVMVWMDELDHFLNPDLFKLSTMTGGMTQDLISITPDRLQATIERLTIDPRYGPPTQITIPEMTNEPLVAWYRNAPSKQVFSFNLAISRQVMVNPFTLQIMGERNWGEIGLSRRLLMSTLFHLHRYLLAGEVGKTIIGISGLVLFITSTAGLVLWWPKHSLTALRQALTISWNSWPRFNHSFHRTTGLLAAPVLLMLGFSGWYFNLPKWVTPVVSSIATVSAPVPPRKGPIPAHGTPLSPKEIMHTAQMLFPDARISRVVLPAQPSIHYEIRMRQPGEVRQGDGATRITLDAFNANVLQVKNPLHAPAGDVFLGWLFPLHNGEAFGMYSRIFMSCFGIVPLLFMLTGTAIWLKRRR